MDKGGLPAVPLGSIRVEPQVRSKLDPKKIELMRASIGEEGLHCPLKLRRLADGTLVVVDGHYRLAALEASGATEALAIIDETPNTDAAVVSAQLATQVRFPLSAMDEARAIDRYLRISGTTAASLARRTAKSEAYICRARALVGLKDEIAALIEAGQLGPSLALELNRVRDPSLYATLLHRARQGSLRREDVERLRKPPRSARSSERPSKSKPPGDSKMVVPLGNGCSLTLSGSVRSITEVLDLLAGLVERARHARDTVRDDVRAMLTIQAPPGT